jgi:hypothetical protein
MGLIADQVIARATRPEHNRTRPATATARKLLEANSSRMVHHLSCAPLSRTERPSLCTVKAFSTPADGFGAGWCFHATPTCAFIWRGTARLVSAATCAPRIDGAREVCKKIRDMILFPIPSIRMLIGRDEAPNERFFKGPSRCIHPFGTTRRLDQTRQWIAHHAARKRR